MLLTDYKIESVLSHFKKGMVNFLSIAENTPIDIVDLIEVADAGGYCLAGGIFPKVICKDKCMDEGVIIKNYSMSEAPFLIKDISKYNENIALPELKSDTKSCVLLIDGLSSGVNNIIENMFEKYWKRITYLGGGCGSSTMERTPCVFTNEGIFEDAALLIMLSENFSLGVSHGWEKMDGPYVANKTDGNKIIELNWRPAFEVYKEVVEGSTRITLDESNFYSVSQDFPFGIKMEDKEDLVRIPIALDSDGEITCLGKINQNVSLNILKGGNDNLVLSAEKAAKEALSEKEPNSVFVVDCVCRDSYLGDDFTKELANMQGVLAATGSDLPIEGVISLGEISSSTGGYLEVYNYTVVVSSTY